jgi:hypothetical protein
MQVHLEYGADQVFEIYGIKVSFGLHASDRKFGTWTPTM